MAYETLGDGEPSPITARGFAAPESPSVSAVGESIELDGVTSAGAGERLVDLTVFERPVPRIGLLAAARWQLAAKRAVDVVGSLTLLLVSLPILVLTAAAILLTSRGPLLYVQRRIGKDGRPFRMYKFRSMRRDAEEQHAVLLHLNEATGPIFKIRDDPRMTTVGRVIRKLSIDELPQLFNVLKGDMSLVGPRPPLPREYDRYGDRERTRMSVRPGITCIWQVSGRSDLEFATWIEMDLAYIQTWSLRRDAAIILRTIPAVLSGRGAY
jgi:exopolysaccharide biosynthesis polyprenyl glycosylphosphotransferase